MGPQRTLMALRTLRHLGSFSLPPPIRDKGCPNNMSDLRGGERGGKRIGGRRLHIKGRKKASLPPLYPSFQRNLPLNERPFRRRRGRKGTRRKKQKTRENGEPFRVARQRIFCPSLRNEKMEPLVREVGRISRNCKPIGLTSSAFSSSASDGGSALPAPPRRGRIHLYHAVHGRVAHAAAAAARGDGAAAAAAGLAGLPPPPRLRLVQDALVEGVAVVVLLPPHGGAAEDRRSSEGRRGAVEDGGRRGVVAAAPAVAGGLGVGAFRRCCTVGVSVRRRRRRRGRWRSRRRGGRRLRLSRRRHRHRRRGGGASVGGPQRRIR